MSCIYIILDFYVYTGKKEEDSASKAKAEKVLAAILEARQDGISLD